MTVITPDDSPLPDWIDRILADTSALQLVFWVAAVGFLVAAIIKLWPALSQFVALVNATAGLPAYIARADARAAEADARHARLEEKVDGIYHETHNNDGSSVKDAVDRIERSIDEEVKPALAKLAQADDDLWSALDDTQNPDEGEPS